MAAPGQAAHSQWPHGLAVSHITVAGCHGQLLHADDAVLGGPPESVPLTSMVGFGEWGLAMVGQYARWKQAEGGKKIILVFPRERVRQAQASRQSVLKQRLGSCRDEDKRGGGENI